MSTCIGLVVILKICAFTILCPYVYIYIHAYVYVSTSIWMHVTHMINYIHDMYIHVCQVLCKAHGKIPMPGIWPDRILQRFASLKWPNEYPNAIQIQAKSHLTASRIIGCLKLKRGTPWETYVFPRQFWRMSSKFPFQVWQRIRSSAVQIQLGQYTAPPSAKVRKSHLRSAVGHLDVASGYDWPTVCHGKIHPFFS